MSKSSCAGHVRTTSNVSVLSSPSSHSLAPSSSNCALVPSILETNDAAYTSEFVRAMTPRSVRALESEGILPAELLWRPLDDFTGPNVPSAIAQMRWRDYCGGREYALSRARIARKRMITGRRSSLLGLPDREGQEDDKHDADDSFSKERPSDSTVGSARSSTHFLPALSARHSTASLHEPHAHAHAHAHPHSQSARLPPRMLHIEQEMKQHPAAAILQQQALQTRKALTARMRAPAPEWLHHVSGSLCGRLKEELIRQREREEWLAMEQKREKRQQRDEEKKASPSPSPPKATRMTRAEFLRHIGPKMAAKKMNAQEQEEKDARDDASVQSAPSNPAISSMSHHSSRDTLQHASQLSQPSSSQGGAQPQINHHSSQAQTQTQTHTTTSSNNNTATINNNNTSHASSQLSSHMNTRPSTDSNSKQPHKFHLHSESGMPTFRDDDYEERIAAKYKNYFTYEQEKAKRKHEDMLAELRRSEKLKWSIIKKQEEHEKKRDEAKRAEAQRRAEQAAIAAQKRIEKYQRVEAEQQEKHERILQQHVEKIAYHQQLYAEKVRMKHYNIWEKMRVENEREEACQQRAEQLYIMKHQQLISKVRHLQQRYESSRQRVESEKLEAAKKRSSVDERVRIHTLQAAQRHMFDCELKYKAYLHRLEKHAVKDHKNSLEKQQEEMNNLLLKEEKHAKRQEILKQHDDVLQTKIERILKKDVKDDMRIKQLQQQKHVEYLRDSEKKRIELQRFERNREREQRKQRFQHNELEKKHKQDMERLKVLAQERQEYDKKREMYQKAAISHIRQFKEKFNKLQYAAITQFDKQSKKLEKLHQEQNEGE